MQGETCFAKKVHGFKRAEILPPAVSDAALEYLQKTTVYTWTLLMPCFLFSIHKK